jgi:hypothetical protein
MTTASVAEIDGRSFPRMENPFLPLAQRTHAPDEIGVHHGSIQRELLLLFQQFLLSVVDNPPNMQDILFVQIGRLETNRLFPRKPSEATHSTSVEYGSRKRSTKASVRPPARGRES